MIRNRIVDHVRVRAGELLPHPLNFRRHPRKQRLALAASFEELGFARSLLGYRREDGQIQLIDGHLRSDLDPDLEVTVEILDVNEEEARQLLLTIDPLAALAEADATLLKTAAEKSRANQEMLNDFWQKLAAEQETQPKKNAPAVEQFLILVECLDEGQQVDLLCRFKNEGLKCKALLS